MPARLDPRQRDIFLLRMKVHAYFRTIDAPKKGKIEFHPSFGRDHEVEAGPSPEKAQARSLLSFRVYCHPG